MMMTQEWSGGRRGVSATTSSGEVRGKEMDSPDYSCNSTPLLPRMLSQHSFISISIVANITHVIILIIVLLTVTAIRMVRGGAEVDTTTRTEVTMIVTGCTTVVG